jgi:hypothetical protein
MSYAPLTNEPVQTTLFESPSEAASVAKFDFSWESDAFHYQDQKRKAENIDFKWNVNDSQQAPSPAASITAMADEQASAAAARKREEKSGSIFHDDTFHLRTNEYGNAAFAAAKKNEDFQELLDEEFGKIQDRQTEIDEARNRINEKIMTPPEPTPKVLVTGENARITADERIQAYLRKADMEMQEALSAGAVSVAASKPEQEYAPASEPIPKMAPSPRSQSSEPESFDPYAHFGGNSFAVPDENDTNRRAFGFKHGEGDIAWEYEHKDYDPAVSAITDDGNGEQAPSYLAGRPVDMVQEHPASAETPIYGSIFVTDFANPFFDAIPSESSSASLMNAMADEKASVPEVSPSVSPFTAGKEPISPEATQTGLQVGIFDTSFANPFTYEPTSDNVTFKATTTDDVAPLFDPANTPPILEPVANQTDLPAASQAQPTMPVRGSSVKQAPSLTPLVQPAASAVFLSRSTADALTQTEPSIPVQTVPVATPEPSAPATPVRTTPEAAQPITPPLAQPEAPAASARRPVPDAPEQAQPVAAQTAVPPLVRPTVAPPLVQPTAPAAPAASTASPAQPMEPPLKPAPVTGMASAPVSSRRQAPDIVNKPVVFPFDETPEDAKDVFKVPESKTPEAHKPVVNTSKADRSTPPVTAAIASVDTPPASPAVAPEKREELATPKEATVSAAKKGKAHTSVVRKRPNKAVIIVVDILIIIAIIVAVCLVIRTFAPDSGASELINKGITKFMQVTGIADNESSAADDNDGVRSSADSGYIMPISDGDALISSQLYNNYNIREVKYDPGASWQEGVRYAIEGAAAAKPLGDDHWKDGTQGPLLYDESAVAAVIRFDSGLVDYVNSGNTNFLATIAVGSPAEKKVAEYVASVSQISVDLLGIGNIRKNGDDLYVWTNETLTEAMDGVPVQRAFGRLYMLTPDSETYKVSDYENIS